MVDSQGEHKLPHGEAEYAGEEIFLGPVGEEEMSRKSSQCQHMLQRGEARLFLNTGKGRQGVSSSCADHSNWENDRKRQS